MQIGPTRAAVPRVRLVGATAGTQRPCPAAVTIGLVVDVMCLEKLRLNAPIDAVLHVAKLMRIRASEAMAERDISVGRDTQQPETGAAGYACSRLYGSPRSCP